MATFNGSWLQGLYFESRGANFKSRGRIYATAHQGRNIEVRGAILGPPGPAAGFFNYFSPGGVTCQVMHSGTLGQYCYNIRLFQDFFCYHNFFFVYLICKVVN